MYLKSACLVLDAIVIFIRYSGTIEVVGLKLAFYLKMKRELY